VGCGLSLGRVYDIHQKHNYADLFYFSGICFQEDLPVKDQKDYLITLKQGKINNNYSQHYTLLMGNTQI
jgi:hypothetical protein